MPFIVYATSVNTIPLVILCIGRTDSVKVAIAFISIPDHPCLVEAPCIDVHQIASHAQGGSHVYYLGSSLKNQNSLLIPPVHIARLAPYVSLSVRLSIHLSGLD